MDTSGKYVGWVQLVAGIAAIFLQIWQATHTGNADSSTIGIGAGVAAGGAHKIWGGR